MSITTFVTRRREAAAAAWVLERNRNASQWITSTNERRARRRLARWDALLDLLTNNSPH